MSKNPSDSTSKASNYTLLSPPNISTSTSTCFLGPCLGESPLPSPSADHPQNNNKNDSNSPLLEPMSAIFDPQTTDRVFKDAVPWRQKAVLVLVGLPARGKSYIANKVVGYLRWRGYKADLFNVGKHRRQVVSEPQGSDFFSASNESAAHKRDELAMSVLSYLLDWLEQGGDLAVFDATNTTRKRREAVVRQCKARNPCVNVVFIESLCDDDKVLHSNYLAKATNSPDYKNMPLSEALDDLKKRVANYEKVYEPINEDELSYIKLINLNSKIICNKITGSMTHSITSYLMAVHIQPRPIYLVRAGHCEGGEDKPTQTLPSANGNNKATPFHIPYTLSMGAHLDEIGRSYSDRLASFLTQKAHEYWHSQEKERQADSSANGTMNNMGVDERTLPLVCYTSTLPRAIETAQPLAEKAIWMEAHSSLNMMDTGVCAGMSSDDIKANYPHIIDQWNADKFNYRFPGGESQRDKARSLVPLIIALEGQRFPTLVVSHASTLQVLYGYFLGMSCDPAMYYSLSIPQHTVIELRPNQYGWQEVRYDLSEHGYPSSSSTQSSPLLPKQVSLKNSGRGTSDLTTLLAAANGGSIPPQTDSSTQPTLHGTQFYS